MSAPSASGIAASIAPQAFEIRPFSGAVGAEIMGLDLALPVNDQDFARIHRAHLQHHVVVFRDQCITPQQQIDFSRRFGILQIHVLKQFLLTGHPEILIVSNIIGIITQGFISGWEGLLFWKNMNLSRLLGGGQPRPATNTGQQTGPSQVEARPAGNEKGMQSGSKKRKKRRRKR